MENEETKAGQNPYASPQVECMEASPDDLVFSTLRDDPQYRYFREVAVLCWFGIGILLFGLRLYLQHSFFFWIPGDIVRLERVLDVLLVIGIMAFILFNMEQYERRVKSPIYIDKRIVSGIQQGSQLKRESCNWSDIQSIRLNEREGLHIIVQSGNQTCIITAHLQDFQLENLAAIIDRYENRTRIETAA